ncbi:MAG TPA: MFS transporter [Rhizomicrobium sp.]|nr:MFS transporter [Rhizomicrobium sp.]
MLKPDRIQTERSHGLSVLHLLAYVLPAVPLAALGMPIAVYLPHFYASREIGISLLVTGVIFGVVRIFDIVIDPAMGYWSDRWRTPFGRRRPLILLGAPILALGIWMVFVPGGHVGVLHLGFWLFVMYLGWSMTVIPHLSWGAELSSDYHERSRVYGWSQVATLAGFIGVLVIPSILEAYKANVATQVMSMAIFAIVLLLPSVALCLGIVPEPEVKLKTHAAFLPTLKFLLKEDAVRRVISIDLIESINQGARGAMFFYFAQLALGQPHWASKLLLIYFLSGIVFIPAWIALARRIGKHRALVCCYIYGICVGPTFFLIPKGNLEVAIPLFILSGVSYGAPAFLIRAMMADIADADTAEHGAERAGLMYSFLSLTNKFGLGAAVLVAFPILARMGFDPKIVNTPAAIDHLRIFFILLPMGLAMTTLLIASGYKLDQARQERLRAKIAQARAEHHSAEDIMPPPGLLPGGVALASDSEAITKFASDSR